MDNKMIKLIEDNSEFFVREDCIESFEMTKNDDGKIGSLYVVFIPKDRQTKLFFGKEAQVNYKTLKAWAENTCNKKEKCK
jgi:hypothetical protein